MDDVLLPFVSICTPTFNRRPFIPYLIECVRQQDYLKERIEWIIVDDGSDCVGDLFIEDSTLPAINYEYLTNPLPLGAKRNYMHTKCKGDIIIYMDDDDYYPVERISHAVSMLTTHPEYDIAGSSLMHIYFPYLGKLYSSGPYGKNHATAATFAFHRRLLSTTSYLDTQTFGEERDFLKDRTIPLLQLDPMKTILVLSHAHSTTDKNKLLDNPSTLMHEITNMSLTDMLNPNTDFFLSFYTSGILTIFDTYAKGNLDNKPLDLQFQLCKKELELCKKELDFYKKEFEQKNKSVQNLEIQLTDKTTQLAHKTAFVNELLKKLKNVKNIAEQLKTVKGIM